MCGVFAWWSEQPVVDGAQRSLQALTALLPRGPDEQHLWINEERTVHLGHCRLKITGENGGQPLWNAQRTVAAVVNGQFYHHQQLREECRANGYTFQTDSDSEILLALYERFGVECLHHLDGEFAFVLWDRPRHCVFAARDRCGIKPLKYLQQKGDLVFASEAKAFFAGGWPAQWDHHSLAQALTFQYPSPQRTLFENIKQVAPGCYLMADLATGAVIHQRWWTWSETAEPGDYLSALRDSVAERVDGVWPTAVHLSAGCDSTTALVMARELGREVTAFSVAFEQDGGAVAHDESVDAAQTARVLNVPFEKVMSTRMDMCTHWATAIERSEQLGINGHLVAKWLLAKAIAQKGFRVSISGEGADETLLGYSFLTAELGANVTELVRSNPVAVGLMLPDDHQLDFTVVEQQWGFVPVWLQAKASLGWKLRTLLKDEWAETYAPQAQSDWARETRDLLKTEKVETARTTWAVLALGGYILPALADAPEAGHHIQGRVPFLGKQVMEQGLALDAQTLGFPLQTKKPLRDFLREKGLGHIADRAKHPFQAPPLLGSSEVQMYLKTLWSEDTAWTHTPFCPTKIQQWMQQWPSWDQGTYQKWEPVVSTVLSVYWMQRVFLLRN